MQFDAEYDKVVAENKQLRGIQKKVVEVALRLKKNRRYCEEVERLLVEAGLGEYVPNRVVVQIKYQSNYGWSDVDYWDDNPANRERANRSAATGRKCEVDGQRSNHSRNQRWAKQSFDSNHNASVNYFETTVTAKTNIETAIASLKAAYESVKSAEVREFKPAAFKPSIYPKYRVVLKKPGSKRGEIVEVLHTVE